VLTGRPIAFIAAVAIIVAWAATGPIFNFNDTWQLVINTGTTIITFLMVFLIQSTQNRDTAAIHIKLDELIRCTEGAHNALLDLEELEEKDVERLRADYEELAAMAREDLAQGKSDTEIRETKSSMIEEQEQKRGRR
jgi:low affinity Fe/Cu permease